MDMGAANEAAVDAFVRALAVAGVQHACVTPGSRSTPLTVALAGQSAIRPWLHLDERSSAFFALGLARATGRPVLLVCTSGTAAANYFPAVVEANLSRIPLVVCTADRPPRLRDVGADQTIDQHRMYGANARWAVDLPLPVGQPGETSQFRTFATRAVRAALSPLPGPVHVNFPFEEPLLSGEALGAPSNERPSESAFASPSLATPNAHDIAVAAAKLATSRRPLIVAGPETGGLPAAEIADLAAVTDVPILADPLGGLRTGNHDRTRVLDSYDAVLRDPHADDLPPDCIVRFGAPPVSKALNQFLARQRNAEHILCESATGWRDPWALATAVVTGAPQLVAGALAAAAGARTTDAGWTEAWITRNRSASRMMQTQAADFAEPFEGRVFTELQALVAPGSTIFAGNSMPIRDADSFLITSDRPLNVVANRGANGIDGVTSSALGQAASGTGPVVLVIGDLSFYHDMNGLWAAARHRLDLTIVLVNNNGGGIFHYLPQAAYSSIFEDWFGTPSNLEFSHAVEMYGGRFTSTQDWATFREAVTDRRGGLNVIELRTDRARNVEMHRQAWAAAAAAAWTEAPV